MSSGDAELNEQVPVFRVTCTRCRKSHSYDSAIDLSTAMVFWSNLGDGIAMCPPCADIVSSVRRPFLDAAYDAAIHEINEYHKNNPAASLLSVISEDKGEVH